MAIRYASCCERCGRPRGPNVTQPGYAVMADQHGYTVARPATGIVIGNPGIWRFNACARGASFGLLIPAIKNGLQFL